MVIWTQVNKLLALMFLDEILYTSGSIDIDCGTESSCVLIRRQAEQRVQISVDGCICGWELTEFLFSQLILSQ